MDANVKEIIKIKMEACKKALEKNGMKAYLVEDAQAARELVNAMIKDHETVCDGGTMTLQETGILDMLNHRDLVFHSHSDPTMTREQSDAEARKAFSADTFIASTNAVTLQGELVNIDGHGNRVSAMIFGPKQVIIVAGYNKIVEDEEAAKKRIREIALQPIVYACISRHLAARQEAVRIVTVKIAYAAVMLRSTMIRKIVSA